MTMSFNAVATNPKAPVPVPDSQLASQIETLWRCLRALETTQDEYCNMLNKLGGEIPPMAGMPTSAPPDSSMLGLLTLFVQRFGEQISIQEFYNQRFATLLGVFDEAATSSPPRGR